MQALAIALLSAISNAALHVIAKLVAPEVFEKVFIKLLIVGAQKLMDSTDNKALDEVCKIIIERLQEQSPK